MTAVATPPAKTRAAKKTAGTGITSGQARQVATQIKLLSVASRLQVVLILAEGEKNVGEICAALGMSQPATSHHLALLRHGGLVSPRRQGKHNFYEITETGRKLATLAQSVMD